MQHLPFEPLPLVEFSNAPSYWNEFDDHCAFLYFSHDGLVYPGMVCSLKKLDDLIETGKMKKSKARPDKACGREILVYCLDATTLEWEVEWITFNRPDGSPRIAALSQENIAACKEWYAKKGDEFMEKWIANVKYCQEHNAIAQKANHFQVQVLNPIVFPQVKESDGGEDEDEETSDEEEYEDDEDVEDEDESAKKATSVRKGKVDGKGEGKKESDKKGKGSKIVLQKKGSDKSTPLKSSTRAPRKYAGFKVESTIGSPLAGEGMRAVDGTDTFSTELLTHLKNLITCLEARLAEEMQKREMLKSSLISVSKDLVESAARCKQKVESEHSQLDRTLPTREQQQHFFELVDAWKEAETKKWGYMAELKNNQSNQLNELEKLIRVLEEQVATQKNSLSQLQQISKF